MSEEEQEKAKSYSTSFRLTEIANARLLMFCKMTGMNKSEVVKASISQFIAPTLQNANVIPLSDNPRAHTCVDNVIISKDIMNCNTETKKKNEKQEEIHAWADAFWEVCKRQLFFRRVIKTVRLNWDVLSELDPKIIADKYNEYFHANGNYAKHPNAWLNDGGYDNHVDNSISTQGLNFDITEVHPDE
jgi:heme-binding NEAT domain protein